MFYFTRTKGRATIPPGKGATRKLTVSGSSLHLTWELLLLLIQKHAKFNFFKDQQATKSFYKIKLMEFFQSLGV